MGFNLAMSFWQSFQAEFVLLRVHFAWFLIAGMDAPGKVLLPQSAGEGGVFQNGNTHFTKGGVKKELGSLVLDAEFFVHDCLGVILNAGNFDFPGDCAVDERGAVFSELLDLVGKGINKPVHFIQVFLHSFNDLTLLI